MKYATFKEIINNRKFKNINGLIFKPINFNESKNEMTFQVTNPNNNDSWEETWNDLNATIAAFQIGEYMFIS